MTGAHITQVPRWMQTRAGSRAPASMCLGPYPPAARPLGRRKSRDSTGRRESANGGHRRTLPFAGCRRDGTHRENSFAGPRRSVSSLEGPRPPVGILLGCGGTSARRSTVMPSCNCQRHGRMPASPLWVPTTSASPTPSMRHAVRGSWPAGRPFSAVFQIRRTNRRSAFSVWVPWP